MEVLSIFCYSCLMRYLAVLFPSLSFYLRLVSVPVLAAYLLPNTAVAEVEFVYDPATESRALEVFSSVSSPFCPGRLLRDCPSSAASGLKNDVRLRFSEGATVDEVMEYLYSTYGDEIRAAPPRYGFGRLAWLMPPLFLLIGGVFLLGWLRGKRTAGAETGSVARAVDPAILAEIEKDLKK